MKRATLDSPCARPLSGPFSFSWVRSRGKKSAQNCVGEDDDDNGSWGRNLAIVLAFLAACLRSFAFAAMEDDEFNVVL